MGKRESARKSTSKGAQAHAEGAHGARTHAAFLEQLHSPGVNRKASNAGRSDAGAGEPDRQGGASSTSATGKNRLWEDREQHDEAEKNAEQNRLAKELGERGAGREDAIDPDRR